MSKFTITEDHLKLLARSFYAFEEGGYYGAVLQDEKRPYGNSDVLDDLHEILKGSSWDYEEHEVMPDELEAELLAVHKEMGVVVQILVLSAGKGFPFEAGRTYVKTRQYNDTSWVPA